MKIREIMLIAYGPFTDVRIDLREGEEGLHIIYGPNEAGKSSALRALRSMLFGIPDRTSDDFLHPYTKMRVGAAMQSADGDVLECVRLKGRSSTLRAVDEKTILDASILNQYLKGVDADLFRTMFGIDNAELVRGGKEIIQGGGPMGRIIFAAGSGVANLRAVQEELKSEVALLFKPWGQKPRINATLHKLNKIRKVLRDAQLPGREWVNHDQALQEAQERKQTVDQELARKQRDRHRLERIRAALPMIAERNALLEELKEYASAAVLSENFGEKRRELITRLRIAESNRNQAIQNMEMLKKEMAKIQVNESLLEKSEFIEAAYQELGSHRKAAVDRDKLLARKDILRGEAKDILHGLHDDVKLEDADKLRVNRTDRVRIQELGNQFERIITRMENSQDAIPNLTYGIDKIDIQLKALDAPKGVDPLKDLLVEAEELGALEKRCREDQREIRNDLKTLEMHIKKQPLWSGAMEELESLPVPSLDSIDMFEDRIYKAEGALRDLTSEKMNVQDNLATIEKQIGELRHEQDVPTEEDLQHARDKRSQGWRFIQSRLQGDLIPDEEVHDFMQWFQPSSTLAEAFEASVLQADDIADRLRRDADHVAALENLLAEKSAQKKQFQGLKKDVDAAEKGLSEIRDKWAQLWQPSGIMPLSPREMRGWAQSHAAMAAKATEIRGRKSKVDALQENIEKQRKALDQCLQSLDEPRAEKDETLAALIKRSRKVCEKQEKLRLEKKKLLTEKEQKEKDLAEAMSRVDKSSEELSQWQRQWEHTVRPLGLDADSKPSQANAVIEDLKSMFEMLKEADILEKRIKGIDRDTLEFTARVTSLAQQVAKDLADLPADQSAIELNIMLTRSRAAQTRLQTYER
ncbi:MAG: AAA family ATPase, partial [Deltaproteobacteria bacterium]|nr:AAA family ATPase [Deltaproteobacteria bacterium]